MNNKSNKNNVDILDIDFQIKRKFNQEKESLSFLKDKLSTFEKIQNNVNLSYKLKNEITNLTTSLKKQIEDITYEYSYNFYVLETSLILEEYKKLLKIPVKVSFFTKIKKSLERNQADLDIGMKKKNLTKKYIDIASKHLTNLEEILKFKSELNIENNICLNCGNSKSFETIDGGKTKVCIICGNQIDTVEFASSYKDINRINITAKYSYEKRVHFRECIYRYQGKQSNAIKDKVYKDLIKLLIKNDLLLGDENTQKEVRFSKVNKQHIYLFLKESNNSKHYEDVNLIYTNLTGKPNDDISHLEDKLMEDFDILCNTYMNLFKNNKKIDRKSFIHSQFVLYQLLKKNKHPCKKEDFSMLTSQDRIDFHNEIGRDLFSHLGWTFYPI
jgi:hypothetical protein